MNAFALPQETQLFQRLDLFQRRLWPTDKTVERGDPIGVNADMPLGDEIHGQLRDFRLSKMIPRPGNGSAAKVQCPARLVGDNLHHIGIAEILEAVNGLAQGCHADAIIGGQVTGSVTAESRLELQATSVIDGEIQARRIKLDEGGRVNGRVSTGEIKAIGSGKAAAGAAKPVAATAEASGST
jgi:hypothetical protein